MSDNVKHERSGSDLSVERTRDGVVFEPRVDIIETDEGLVLRADVPGAAADTLDMRFEDRELTIHAAVPARHESKKCLYREYDEGDFYRAFQIGENIDASAIHAEISNGVLTVYLPKTEAVKPRRIEVRAG